MDKEKLMEMIREYGRHCTDQAAIPAVETWLAIEKEVDRLLAELARLRAQAK